ncbi:hypothetical protein MKW98_002899 [Papaver atlanticum]|uniref:Uncharacterized protein n=1 Tax=Papaver atlanticum TaxID=357466 RepID=A0AAD4XTP0_9MAGN|nr:hypothetical protein MKW98_002899 [Papaver atlanticum]
MLIMVFSCEVARNFINRQLKFNIMAVSSIRGTGRGGVSRHSHYRVLVSRLPSFCFMVRFEGQLIISSTVFPFSI